jgi:hypothetical protein
MLKITKNQVKKGQQVVVKLSTLVPKKDKYGNPNDATWALSEFTKQGFKDGDIITIQSLSGGLVKFESNGKEFNQFWSWFKVGTEALGGVNLGEDNVEYVVLYEGVKINNKYKDMGKVKTSLLNLMNYYDKLESLVQNHLDKVPELRYMQTPEFLGSSKNLSRKDFEKVEIFTWKNRKIGEKVTDFDPVAFYDNAMLLVKVTAQFGSSTRDLFKETRDTHNYILTFMHEDYRNSTLKYVDYEYLKESNIIKDAITNTFGKTVRSLDIKKKNKSGKTSLAFKEQSDAIKLMKSLPEGSFFICNMQGDQLVEQSEALIKQEFRNSLIDNILS